MVRDVVVEDRLAPVVVVVCCGPEVTVFVGVRVDARLAGMELVVVIVIVGLWTV